MASPETKEPAPPKKSPPPCKRDWLRTAGWAKEDTYYEEAVQLGAEYRRSMTWQKEAEAGNADS